jgi:hypothetical protein
MNAEGVVGEFVRKMCWRVSAAYISAVTGENHCTATADVTNAKIRVPCSLLTLGAHLLDRADCTCVDEQIQGAILAASRLSQRSRRHCLSDANTLIRRYVR